MDSFKCVSVWQSTRGVSLPIQVTRLQSITIHQTIHVMHARKFFVCVHYHFTADCKPQIKDFIHTYQIRLLNWRWQDIVCTGLKGIQANIRFIQNLITCVTIVPGVMQFVPAIRTRQHALSKYMLGHLCNHTFLDPCCHTLFFRLSIWGIHSWSFAVEFWYALCKFVEVMSGGACNSSYRNKYYETSLLVDRCHTYIETPI
jgi:hypothetical protein